MRAVIERMEAEALTGPVAPETDRLFHDLLYQPLENPLVGQLLGAFWEVYDQLRDDLSTPDETPADVARKHRDIYAAVVTGDRAAADAAMRATSTASAPASHGCAADRTPAGAGARCRLSRGS